MKKIYQVINGRDGNSGHTSLITFLPAKKPKRKSGNFGLILCEIRNGETYGRVIARKKIGLNGRGLTSTNYFKNMKIYGIAEKGNFGGDEYIQKRGGWGFYEFPPFFKTREAAEDWIKKKELIGRHIEELELED